MNLRVAIAVLLLLFLLVFTVGAALDERDHRGATSEPNAHEVSAFDGFDCPLHLLVIREMEVAESQVQPFAMPDSHMPPNAGAPYLEPSSPLYWMPEPTSQLSTKEVVI